MKLNIVSMGHTMSNHITVYISVPNPFVDELEELHGLKENIFNVVSNRNTFDTLVTPEKLIELTTRLPQVQVLDAFNYDGTRYGETLTVDDEGVETISGEPIYTPNPATLGAALPDKINYDQDGNQIGTTPRVLSDDDTHRWFGWDKRRF